MFIILLTLRWKDSKLKKKLKKNGIGIFWWYTHLHIVLNTYTISWNSVHQFMRSRGVMLTNCLYFFLFMAKILSSKWSKLSKNNRIKIFWLFTTILKILNTYNVKWNVVRRFKRSCNDNKTGLTHRLTNGQVKNILPPSHPTLLVAWDIKNTIFNCILI